MSQGGSDCSYQPRKSAVSKDIKPKKSSRPVRGTRVDYKEVEILSSDSEEQESVVREQWLSDTVFKAEADEGELDQLQCDTEPTWTPQTIAFRTKQLTRQITKFASSSSEIHMAREQEHLNVMVIMQIMLEMRTEDRKAEKRRVEEDRKADQRRVEDDKKAEQRRVEKEEARREEDLRRETRMLIALQAAQPAVPQTVTIQNHKLPEMREGEDMDQMFVAMFEAALRSNDIPQAQRKGKFHCHITFKAKIKIQCTIQDHMRTLKRH